MKVLHCDDEDIYLRDLRKILKTMPEVTSITGVDDAKQAISKLEKEHFDLVISDMGMPLMDGLELLKVIKQRWPAIPVIMYSFSSFEKKGKPTIELGALSFLGKDAQITEVKEAVQAALKGEKYISSEMKRADKKKELDKLMDELKKKYDR